MKCLHRRLYGEQRTFNQLLLFSLSMIMMITSMAASSSSESDRKWFQGHKSARLNPSASELEMATFATFHAAPPTAAAATARIPITQPDAVQVIREDRAVDQSSLHMPQVEQEQQAQSTGNPPHMMRPDREQPDEASSMALCITSPPIAPQKTTHQDIGHLSNFKLDPSASEPSSQSPHSSSEASIDDRNSRASSEIDQRTQGKSRPIPIPSADRQNYEKTQSAIMSTSLPAPRIKHNNQPSASAQPPRSLMDASHMTGAKKFCDLYQQTHSFGPHRPGTSAPIAGTVLPGIRSSASVMTAKRPSQQLQASQHPNPMPVYFLNAEMPVQNSSPFDQDVKNPMRRVSYDQSTGPLRSKPYPVHVPFDAMKTIFNVCDPKGFSGGNGRVYRCQLNADADKYLCRLDYAPPPRHFAVHSPSAAIFSSSPHPTNLRGRHGMIFVSDSPLIGTPGATANNPPHSSAPPLPHATGGHPQSSSPEMLRMPAPPSAETCSDGTTNPASQPATQQHPSNQQHAAGQRVSNFVSSAAASGQFATSLYSCHNAMPQNVAATSGGKKSSGSSGPDHQMNAGMPIRSGGSHHPNTGIWEYSSGGGAPRPALCSNSGVSFQCSDDDIQTGVISISKGSSGDAPCIETGEVPGVMRSSSGTDDDSEPAAPLQADVDPSQELQSMVLKEETVAQDSRSIGARAAQVLARFQERFRKDTCKSKQTSSQPEMANPPKTSSTPASTCKEEFGPNPMDEMEETRRAKLMESRGKEPQDSMRRKLELHQKTSAAVVHPQKPSAAIASYSDASSMAMSPDTRPTVLEYRSSVHSPKSMELSPEERQAIEHGALLPFEIRDCQFWPLQSEGRTQLPQSKMFFAVKELDLSKTSLLTVEREVQSLYQICGLPNVVRYVTSFYNLNLGKAWIVTEWIGGRQGYTLRDVMPRTGCPDDRKDRKFRELLIRVFCRDIFMALAATHGRQRLLHGDLKPSNILAYVPEEDCGTVDAPGSPPQQVLHPRNRAHSGGGGGGGGSSSTGTFKAAQDAAASHHHHHPGLHVTNSAEDLLIQALRHPSQLQRSGSSSGSHQDGSHHHQMAAVRVDSLSQIFGAAFDSGIVAEVVESSLKQAAANPKDSHMDQEDGEIYLGRISREESAAVPADRKDSFSATSYSDEDDDDDEEEEGMDMGLHPSACLDAHTPAKSHHRGSRAIGKRRPSETAHTVAAAAAAHQESRRDQPTHMEECKSTHHASSCITESTMTLHKRPVRLSKKTFTFLAADFGNSFRYIKGTSTAGIATCTVGYQSPQMAGSHEFTLKHDIFSVGLMVYEMCTGMRYSEIEPPSGCHHQEKKANAAADRESLITKHLAAMKEPPVIDKRYSAALQDLLSKALAVEEADRPTALELLQHPFITGKPWSASSPSEPNTPCKSTKDGGSSRHAGRTTSAEFFADEAGTEDCIAQRRKSSQVNPLDSTKKSYPKTSRQDCPTAKQNPISNGQNQIGLLRKSNQSATIACSEPQTKSSVMRKKRVRAHRKSTPPPPTYTAPGVVDQSMLPSITGRSESKMDVPAESDLSESLSRMSAHQSALAAPLNDETGESAFLHRPRPFGWLRGPDILDQELQTHSSAHDGFAAAAVAPMYDLASLHGRGGGRAVDDPYSSPGEHLSDEAAESDRGYLAQHRSKSEDCSSMAMAAAGNSRSSMAFDGNEPGSMAVDSLLHLKRNRRRGSIAQSEGLGAVVSKEADSRLGSTVGSDARRGLFQDRESFPATSRALEESKCYPPGAEFPHHRLKRVVSRAESESSMAQAPSTALAMLQSMNRKFVQPPSAVAEAYDQLSKVTTSKPARSVPKSAGVFMTPSPWPLAAQQQHPSNVPDRSTIAVRPLITVTPADATGMIGKSNPPSASSRNASPVRSGPVMITTAGRASDFSDSGSAAASSLGSIRGRSGSAHDFLAAHKSHDAPRSGYSFRCLEHSIPCPPHHDADGGFHSPPPISASHHHNQNHPKGGAAGTWEYLTMQVCSFTYRGQHYLGRPEDFFDDPETIGTCIVDECSVPVVRSGSASYSSNANVIRNIFSDISVDK